MNSERNTDRRRPAPRLHLLCLALLLLSAFAMGHPLGNFTINHYARLSSGTERALIRYVVDMAEIPTFQEAKRIDANGDGTLSQEELDAYLERVAPDYISGLRLTADDRAIELRLKERSIRLVPGQANLPTMRLVFDLEADAGAAAVRWRFENNNHRDRAGWYELSVTPLTGAAVYDSTIYGDPLTDELRAYPEDLLQAPLGERKGEWSVASGLAPAGSRPLLLRDGKSAPAARDRFTELILAPQLSLGVALMGLLAAFFLGSAHALTPGHSKAIVGAYLIGARGTIKHAAFLGLTVTITHVSSAYALSLLLIGFNLVAPEQLQIIPSLISSLLVIVLGLTLFARRLRSLFSPSHHHHDHHHHGHAHDHEHGQDGDDAAHAHRHDHGGGEHSHLPPGADGTPVTWRSLLALGVSGGLLPCPSAILVVLAANALGRDLYGLLLVTAFSLGLAGVLTGIGVIFIKAGDYLKLSPRAGRLARALPVASAAFIAAIGLVMLSQALDQAGVSASTLWQEQQGAGVGAVSIASTLGIGLVLGLKHAIEADHLAAVAAIVSERKSILGSSLVGGLWGLGHTLSLLIAGVIVIFLKIQIPERVALSLEFVVALMLIGLGINALLKIRRGARLHLHEHTHGGITHMHPHLHEHEAERATHHGMKIGLRPLVVGMVHGMAGSAALMLLVLPTIPSPALALVYIAVFGLGSIGGMMAVSTLLGLPLKLTAERFTRAHSAVCALAAIFSLGFGIFLAYEIGFVEGLLK